jgi:amino acid transporter
MQPAEMERAPTTARLGLWDTTSMIVGIIIGVGIYNSGKVFGNTSGPWEALALWVLGGVVSFLGALCFAELASTYPRSGGEYVYLTRAFGPWAGFLFGWAQMAVIRPAGSIGVLAFLVADYADRLFPLGLGAKICYAFVPIVVLTLINVAGVPFGKRTQNLLTALKVLGIGGILLAGFLRPAAPAAEPPHEAPLSGLAFAMVLVLWTYAGWHEGAYVAAEVRDRRRNLPLALLLGTAIVTTLYLLINLAYLAGLGFAEAGRSDAVAADLLQRTLGEEAGWVMGLLVVISALGGLNGQIFTSSRIFAELGVDHALFAPLAKWDRRLGTPVRALLLGGALSAGMVLMVALLGSGRSGFDTLLECTAAVFWLFFLLTGVAVFVLRSRDRQLVRPFTVPGYPWTVVLFCVCCAGMLVGSLLSYPLQTLVGTAFLSAGLPLYLISRHLGGGRRPDRPQEAVAVLGVGEQV